MTTVGYFGLDYDRSAGWAIDVPMKVESTAVWEALMPSRSKCVFSGTPEMMEAFKKLKSGAIIQFDMYGEKRNYRVIRRDYKRNKVHLAR